MWILTAVGPVHGFTHVLEQNKSYKLGRDKGHDIVFDSKSVRPTEGTLQVGDWNPSKRTTAPTLVWKPEQKKSGNAYFPAQVLTPLEEIGSLVVDDYSVDKRENQSEIVLEHGSGLKLSADSWFTVRWEPVHISFDKMKDEDEDFTASLRRFCVSWTLQFQQDDLPTIVVSGQFKSSPDCYFAVGYGVPIVSEQWLYNLTNRLRACWKKIADSVDSFTLPDSADPALRPPYDPSLRNAPANPGFWITRPANRTLFVGWRVVGLKAARPLMDRRYYLAMGAKFDEVDILNPLPMSSADFISRIAGSIEAAQQANEKLVVMHLPSMKANLQERGVNFESVIVNACAASGIYFVSGAILWGSVLRGGVQNYFDAMRTDDGPAPTGASAAPSAAPEPPRLAAALAPSAAPAPPEPPAEPIGRLTRRAGTRASSRAPSVPPAQPDAVPSTFPDDVAMTSATPVKEAPKKPLKRRTGREPKLDTFDDLDLPDPSPASQLFPSAQPLESQGSSGPSDSLQSRIPDSIMDVDAPFAAPSASSRPSGRLKRRAGAAQTQPSFLDLDTSVAFSAKKEKEDRMAEQRELYEELNRETLGMPAFKRARTREPNSQPPESQDIEVDEENDFVSKALRSARRTVKTENVSPKKPTSRSSRQASPQKPAPIAEEEEEEPEPEPVLEPEPELDLQKKAPKKAAPGAVRAPGSQVDRDEKFLQAIQKNTRKKQDMDELDKEFNQLRIPKPRNGKATWDPPDYSVLWDFDDNLRGNFIEVIRKDLFRKDAPRAAAPAADDGRPNFKKFKKKNIVRREPIPLLLSAQHAQAEMGEAYWQTEAPMTQKKGGSGGGDGRSQFSQARVTAFDEDDDMPLVPQSRKPLLTQIPEDDDDDFVVPASRRATQARAASTKAAAKKPSTAAPRRRTRETSAMSAISAVSAISDSPSAAASARSASPAPLTTARRRARRGTQAKPVVIDDSDDDLPFATAPTGSTRTGSRARATATTTAASRMLEESAPATATATASRTTRGTQAASSTRRKLLVEDDDDDDDQGVQKKRRRLR